MKGQKHDSGKQKWHALPLVILEPLAEVMDAGAKKYQKFNCLEPFDNWDERFYNSTMRHIEAAQIDPLAINNEDGGVYHLAQAAFGCLLRLHNALREEQINERKDQIDAVNLGLTGSPVEGDGLSRTLETRSCLGGHRDQEEGVGHREVEDYKICYRGGNQG